MTERPDTLYWFVAYVRSCQERRVADLLAAQGFETYVPIQKERHKWSDRVKIVDHLVLPRMVFIHTTKAQRYRVAEDFRGRVTGFMSKGGAHNPVIIPDGQMADFQFMVSHGAGEVRIASDPLAPGDTVEILTGPLKGFKCELVTLATKKLATVRLGMLGSAVVEVTLDNVKKVEVEEE